MPRLFLLISMVNLTLGTVVNVNLTLTEKVTLSSPNYLFRFVQRTTNEEILFVKTSADDTSNYKERVNTFSFDVDQLFCGKVGEYHYYVYEQASSSNTELELTGALLEQGIMRLNEDPEDSYKFTTYTTSNTFVTR
jgi:hypothetical protein